MYQHIQRACICWQHRSRGITIASGNELHQQISKLTMKAFPLLTKLYCTMDFALGQSCKVAELDGSLHYASGFGSTRYPVSLLTMLYCTMECALDGNKKRQNCMTQCLMPVALAALDPRHSWPSLTYSQGMPSNQQS